MRLEQKKIAKKQYKDKGKSKDTTVVQKNVESTKSNQSRQSDESNANNKHTQLDKEPNFDLYKKKCNRPMTPKIAEASSPAWYEHT